MPLSATLTVPTSATRLDTLLAAYTPKWPPCYEFTELIFMPESTNSGTIAEGDSSVSISGKIYSTLLAATSPPVIKRVTSTGQRIFANTIYVMASAASQVLHLEATI